VQGSAARWRSAVFVWLIGAAALTASLTGCGTGGAEHPGATTVVASTDVWGSVASAVAGGHVAVKSILTGANADPHTYAASPSDAAAITDAALVVYNGGGYDPWVDRVLAAHPAINSIDAYSLLGTTPDRQPPDEHVFYDLAVAKTVAATIADRLASIDPGHAADYRTNAAAFGRAADAIANSERAIATTYPAAAVVATEPVVYYLLIASGLINRSPVAFTVANENDHDPAPADMASVLDLIEGRQVSALLITPQTSTPATNDLQAAARRAGVPVTEVTETLPGGTDYLTWQRNTVNQLAAALQSGRR
jgi:zinc/manganese transport system substrate-binding protein